MKTLRAAIAAALMIATLASCSGAGGGGDAEDECKTLVEDRLKSPSTAEFGDSASSELGKTGARWEVTGVVDAENSFGGTVRMTYKCDLTYDEGTGTWEAALVDVRE